jgi:hypothetical protein
MDRRPVLARFVQWLAFLGVTDNDSDETRAQKVALTLAASLITALAVIWVATYWALGLLQAASIPFAYQVVSLGSLAVFARGLQRLRPAGGAARTREDQDDRRRIHGGRRPADAET